MALATTLYIQHGKAKAKATEVSTSLAASIGRNIPIEYEWKFVDQAGFKSIPVAEQKSILVDTMGHNLSQTILGAGDSLLAALSASAPLRDLMGTISKIVFSYDYSSTINHPVGANFLSITVEGSSLSFKINLNAVKVLNNGDWGVLAKLLALVGAATSAPATLVSSGPVIQTPPVPVVSTPPPQVYQQPVVAISQHIVPAPVAAASAPMAVKYQRQGGAPGGNGASTFLYMTTDKLKKRVAEIGVTLSGKVGYNVSIEVDWNSLIKDSAFTKDSEVDQKAILLGPVIDSIEAAMFGATNGWSTIEAALRVQPGIGKIKYSFSSLAHPTPGWGFLEVVSGGSELIIKCPITSADETYGTAPALAVQPQIPAIISYQPLAAAVPVVAPVPVAVPVAAHTPVVAVPVAVPVAAPVSAPAPVAVAAPPAPTGPIPGSKYVKVGGKAGGNGTTGFLYTPLEKLKKMVADNYTKEFATAIGSSRCSITLDATFSKNAEFIKNSEADQRGIVMGPMMDNIAQILFKSPNGDHIAGLFKNPKFMDRTINITKIAIVFAADVTSTEGFKFSDFIWDEGGTSIQFRIHVEEIDVWFDPATWSIAAKATEGISGIEKRAAQAAIALQERQQMAALEAQAKANANANAARAAEEKAAAAKLAEQEKIRKEHEAGIADRIRILEEANVTPRLRENQARLKKMIDMTSGEGAIEFLVDDIFLHDKKLRWRDCGTQKTTLKSISIEEWSLFNIITDACILILESGEVGQKKLLESYKKVNLQFEAADPKATVPKLVYDSGSSTLNVFATFSNMYDPRKWLDELLAGAPAKNIYMGTTIAEYFKALIADSAGWMEDMARDESTNMINDLLAPYFKEHFEGRVIPIEVDWKSLDSTNASSNLIVRMKKHYQFPPCVLEVLFKSFAQANSVVMAVLRKKLQKIKVIASGSDAVVLDDDGALMTVTYKWGEQNYTEKQWKAVIEEQVRAKCQGLTVKNVSAEIAMAEAAPAVVELNRILCGKLGMRSASGGYDVLVVDYPSFVDTLDFNKRYGASKFGVLHNSNLNTLKALVKGFEDVSTTTLGGPFIKTIKRIHVTLDIKSKDNTDDAPLQWDDSTKTFTVTHSFHSFEHPQDYVYMPRIEYTCGILIESCRVETKKQVEKFYITVRSDFGLNSLPVLIDESYQQTKEFTSIHPANMKAIVMRMFTTLPPSIFHGPMGLKHCSEFPKARQIMHDKVKSITLLPDGKLASNTSKVELNNNQLVVRVSFDNKDWTTPIGYQLSQMIQSRPMIESEVIAEVDSNLVSFTNQLRKESGNSAINVKFDWKELQADKTFQSAQNYVNDYVRYIVQKVKIAFEGTKSTYDGGLIEYCHTQKLGPALKPFTDLIFHMSTTNQVGTQGKFGLFTPYYYEVTTKSKELHVRFNFDTYPVGIGSIVEWVINYDSALVRQQQHVVSIAERNYNEEMKRREDEVNSTIAANEEAQARYVRDVEDYNHDMKVFAATPNTKNCSSCSGKGYWGRGNTCSSCRGRGWVDVRKTAPVMPVTPAPRPMPTFPHVTVDDFTKGQDRGELRNGHYVEGKDDQSSKQRKFKSTVADDADLDI